MGLFGVLIIVGLSVLFYKKLQVSLFASIALSVVSTFFLVFLLTIVWTIGFVPMLVIVMLSTLGVYLYYRKIEKDWKEREFQPLSAIEVYSAVTNLAEQGDMVLEKIPTNRAEYFNLDSNLKYSDDVYPIIYNASPNKNEMTFVEYGYLVTTNELVYKWQVKKKEITNKNDKYTFEKISIPMYGLYKKYYIFNHLILFYEGQRLPVIIQKSPSIFNKVIDYVIESGWSKQVQSVLQEKATSDDEISQLEKQIDNIDNVTNDMEKEIKQSVLNKNFLNAQTLSYIPGIISELNANSINARFSKSGYDPTVSAKGHGIVAEQAGNAFDRLFFRNAVPLGAKIDPETKRIEKWGADRKVNSTLVQTKFYKKASDSIGQAFSNGKPKYINKKTGKMMKIEVPRDQYSKAVENMGHRIKKGHVPGETDPKNANKYVKKSPLSYEESKIATTSIFDRPSNSYVKDKNGNRVKVTFGQKLVYSAGLDFVTGASIALPSSVISGVWVYCTCKWNGFDEKEARKQAIIGMIRPIMFSGFTYMIASQFAGSHIGQKIGQKAIMAGFSKKFITPSNKNATRFMTGTTLTVISVGVTVGPDVYNLIRGRISSKQLIKNTVTTGIGGVSDMAVGSAVGSIVPVVGTFVGGMAGSVMGTMISKKVLDQFVEDDAVTMLRIAKEEFIENVILVGLTKSEFNEIMNNTFLKKDFNKLLKLMFASENPREFIKEIYLDLVTQAYSLRSLPKVEEISGYLKEQNLIEHDIVS
ncbi:hypothetical protein MUA41_01070 [Staphylococcus simulans]|uniref:hypothetical protein n=1 Tax=Staphylococcus simulans TaxID=1286 RepID=UPI0021D093D1|nr:hypothetical protein [Staphylococcus simulans]UXR38090.1 hypothetical protein MUA41_01070 [Staphylococcus simulans]